MLKSNLLLSSYKEIYCGILYTCSFRCAVTNAPSKDYTLDAS